MWKSSLYIVAFVAIFLGASGCGAGPSDVKARLNEEFSLSVGQRALITGENLEIRFDEMTGDSRCPREVTCVWAGRVTCVVEITRASASYRMAVTEPGLSDEYSRESYEEYELAFHVTPYPEAGKEIAKDTYRLHLIISRVPELAEIIGSIIAEPFAFAGQDITIVGYYCGVVSLQEAKTSPPVMRSDRVVKDSTGVIYVSANSEAKVPEGLNPSSAQDTGVVLEVQGVVLVTGVSQPYIEAISIERVSQNPW